MTRIEIINLEKKQHLSATLHESFPFFKKGKRRSMAILIENNGFKDQINLDSHSRG